MIICQACGNQNPIATRYCRACGAKLEVLKEQLFAAVQDDQDVARSKRWIESGRSALMLGAFFLTCGLVLRYAVVPPMPSADVPIFDVGTVIPEQLPTLPAVVPKAPEAAKPGDKPAVPAKPAAK